MYSKFRARIKVIIHRQLDDHLVKTWFLNLLRRHTYTHTVLYLKFLSKLGCANKYVSRTISSCLLTLLLWIHITLLWCQCKRLQRSHWTPFESMNCVNLLVDNEKKAFYLHEFFIRQSYQNGYFLASNS